MFLAHCYRYVSVLRKSVRHERSSRRRLKDGRVDGDAETPEAEDLRGREPWLVTLGYLISNEYAWKRTD